MKPKNCLWCGSEASIWHIEELKWSKPDKHVGYKLGCSSMKCKNKTKRMRTRKAAIAKWNLHKKEEA